MKNQSNQIGSTTRTTLISIAAFGLLMFVAYTFLPKGFSDDLSQIGQGRNIVLLAHDHNSLQSLNLMEFIGEIRSNYLGEIVFIVADNNAIKGKAFIQEQRVNAGDLLFFTPNGNRIRVVQNISDMKTLLKTLNDTF